MYLMSNIRSSFTNIPSHPSKRTLMIITIQQLILSLPAMISRFPALIHLQTSLFQHNIQSLCILFLLCRPRYRSRNWNQRGVYSGGCPGRGSSRTNDGGRYCEFVVIFFVDGFRRAMLMALGWHPSLRRRRKCLEWSLTRKRDP